VVQLTGAGQLHERRPDIVLILPWNIADEVITQNAYVHDWGGIFVVAIPKICVPNLVEGAKKIANQKGQ
jgi:hypothetical protein